MKKVLRNLSYILRHKLYVAIECFKLGLYVHAFTHDLSKFYPSEFFPYMENFYGAKNRRTMDEAWVKHKNRNKHHWDFWVKADGAPIPMPEKYVKQLIADWRGMAKQPQFSTAPEYYLANKHRMRLHKDTDKLIRSYLFKIN